MGRTAVLMVLFIWMWGKERLMTCSVSVTGHPSKRHHGCLCFWSMRLVWLLNGKLISIGMYQQKCFPPSLLFSVRYRFMDVHAVKRFGVSKIIYIYIFLFFCLLCFYQINAALVSIREIMLILPWKLYFIFSSNIVLFQLIFKVICAKITKHHYISFRMITSDFWLLKIQLCHQRINYTDMLIWYKIIWLLFTVYCIFYQTNAALVSIK